MRDSPSFRLGEEVCLSELPDATRRVSLLTQLLDFELKFNPRSSEPSKTSTLWKPIKAHYEKQTGAALPDSVLVATLLIKTSGALQQRLKLNARTLTTCEDMRATILEYHQSRHMLAGASKPPLKPFFLSNAPMRVGAGS